MNTESKDDKIPMPVCIAEMNFDIENAETISNSTDYLESTELDFRTLGHQYEESGNKTYAKLQNATDTKVYIPILSSLNEHPTQGDDVGSISCFADLKNFQDIFSEVEDMEKSAVEIRHSSDNEYKRLTNATETNINVAEEDHGTDTQVMFSDTGLNVCFAELQNFDQLMLETEAVEQTISEDSHESHYDEITIDDINFDHDSDRTSK